MRVFSFVVSLLATSLLSTAASAEVHVVTSVPTLAALVHEVGGSDVDVQALAPPNQDPHFVDGRPSLIVLLHRADLLVHVGLELEVGWLPALVTNARNGRILPGQAGNLDASTVAGPLLEVARGRLDRSMGDVHAGGNPHYLYDPRYGVRVAKAVSVRLAQIDPDHATDYRRRASDFERAMGRRIASWEAAMAPHRGKKVVGYHRSITYLTKWLGLEQVGFVEPLPGVSPSPRHLAQLIVAMKKKQVRAVLSEPWYSSETVEVVASRASASIVRVPGGTGVAGIRSYADFVDQLVRQLSDALSRAPSGS